MTQRLFNGPAVATIKEQPYVAIPVEMEILDREKINDLIKEVFTWLQFKDVEPDGRPFCRYWVIGGVEEKFKLEVGVPIANMTAGNERVIASFIPGGSYASTIHRGPAEFLNASSYALEKWAEDEGLDLDKRYEEQTEIWNGRFEFFPALLDGTIDERNLNVEIAFLLLRDVAA